MRWLLAVVPVILAGCTTTPGDAGSAAPLRQEIQTMAQGPLEEAILGGGCFWCIEAVYDRIEGVVDAVSGYAGGTRPNPTYEQVTSGATGHAEVVRVRFDPSVIPYREILRVFFAMHDPTTRDRQGADVGPQYRSIILTHSAPQKETAQAVIRELEAADTFGAPIVTEIKDSGAFYPAEAYHQDYFANNPQQGYCRIVISPKVAKLRSAFTSRLKPEYR
jgi:peptide-methionine (S)-S-oxide reductase